MSEILNIFFSLGCKLLFILMVIVALQSFGIKKDHIINFFKSINKIYCDLWKNSDTLLKVVTLICSIIIMLCVGLKSYEKHCSVLNSFNLALFFAYWILVTSIILIAIGSVVVIYMKVFQSILDIDSKIRKQLTEIYKDVNCYNINRKRQTMRLALH